MSNEYMSDEMFEELLESVREGGAILRGEKEDIHKVGNDAQMLETTLKKESEKQALINRLSDKNSALMFIYDEEPEAEIPHVKVGKCITLVHPPYYYKALEKWLRLGNWQAISPGNESYRLLTVNEMKAIEIEQYMKEFQVDVLISSFHDNIEWTVFQR